MSESEKDTLIIIAIGAKALQLNNSAFYSFAKVDSALSQMLQCRAKAKAEK